MALLVKTNGVCAKDDFCADQKQCVDYLQVIDVRVDIPKILWSSCNTPIYDETTANANPTSSPSAASENALREFLALGEIDTSIKFACENQLYTHALIISYLTDKPLFEKTMQK